jgi:hypothetical protein
MSEPRNQRTHHGGSPLWCLLQARLFSVISATGVLDTKRPTMRSSVLRLGFACAAAAAFLGGCLTAAAAPVVREADVIPAPARVAFRDGVFAIHARTPISIPRDPGAARIARYFAGLLEQSRGVRLDVVERSNDSLPAGAIAFRLDQPVAAANPESYTAPDPAVRRRSPWTLLCRRHIVATRHLRKFRCRPHRRSCAEHH